MFKCKWARKRLECNDEKHLILNNLYKLIIQEINVNKFIRFYLKKNAIAIGTLWKVQR